MVDYEEYLDGHARKETEALKNICRRCASKTFRWRSSLGLYQGSLTKSMMEVQRQKSYHGEQF